MSKPNKDNVLVIESFHNNGNVSIREFKPPINWHMIKRELERTRMYGSNMRVWGAAP